MTPQALRSQDIAYRLRHAAWSAPEGSDTEHLNIAADEIERLRARVDELARENEHLARQVATRG